MENTVNVKPVTPAKGWNFGLWLGQVILALGFGVGGYGKMAWPMEQINASVPWASAVPEWLMRFIGVSELAGAIGLLLPAMTRIKPGLTPLAAAGLGLIMVLAAGFHLVRGEYFLIFINLIYLALALLIYWGRTKKSPISAR